MTWLRTALVWLRDFRLLTSRRITLQKPTEFLVDYHLSVREPGRPYANYKGGTLAAALRERDNAVPIVLITGQPTEQDKGEAQLLEELPMFDGVVFKGEVIADGNRVADRLVRLADGFEELGRATKTWDGLVAVLRPPSPEDVARLQEIPPTFKGPDWDVVLVARWLERVILRYPGILLDQLYSASALGLDVESFRLDEVQALLADARYQGPLNPPDGRWWKQRLIQIAVSAVSNGARLPLFLHFPEEAERRLGRSLGRAICIDCDGRADAVCSVLRQPVLTEHSLAYFPDQRPQVMDTARVSFRAIIRSNDVREGLIDSNAGDIVAMVRRRAQGPA